MRKFKQIETFTINRMTTLTKFNNTLNEFILNLQDIIQDDYPEMVRSIASFREQLELLRKANPKKIIDSFIYFIYPYREEIMNQKEDFFLKHDFQTEIEDSGFTSLVDVLHIKEIWIQYSNEQMKQTIWEYFQILILLSERWMEEKGGKQNFTFQPHK